MAVEEISLNGRTITTLKELLRPGLKAVFVGLNPAPISVAEGHYHQGRLGRRFWDRLRKHEMVGDVLSGAEDDAAFASGYGFADLVRRPRAAANELTRSEKVAAVVDLANRLSNAGDRPLIIFVYKDAWKYAGAYLAEIGYRVFRMPGPYAHKNLADAELKLRNTVISEFVP